jgi:hypothetical protein
MEESSEANWASQTGWRANDPRDDEEERAWRQDSAVPDECRLRQIQIGTEASEVLSVIRSFG